MITGFNTDVRFEGVTYHVQSEDRGAENPILDTLIYCGGQILHQVKTSYVEILGDDAHEDEIAALLEAQHNDLVRRTRHGEFAGEDMPTMARTAPEDEELGDVILASAASDEELDLLELTFERSEGQGGLKGRLLVLHARDRAPAVGARVTARLVGRGLDPAQVLEGETGEGGALEVAVALPAAGASALVFSAERGAGGGRLRLDL